MTFQVGDKVRLKLSESRASDLEADYLSDLSEGDITGKTYDWLWSIFEQVMSDNSPVFTVCEVGEDGYGLRIGRKNLRYMFPESELSRVQAAESAVCGE
jgi:hypothetical protein